MQWIPSLTVILGIALSFYWTEECLIFLPTLVFGTYIGWIYLRYWQRKTETKLKGDPSDDFAFSTFFPEFLRLVTGIEFIFYNSLNVTISSHGISLSLKCLLLVVSRPVIDPIANIFHRMLCGRSEGSTDEHGYALGGAPLPGSDPIEASRRR